MFSFGEATYCAVTSVQQWLYKATAWFKGCSRSACSWSWHIVLGRSILLLCVCFLGGCLLETNQILITDPYRTTEHRCRMAKRKSQLRPSALARTTKGYGSGNKPWYKQQVVLFASLAALVALAIGFVMFRKSRPNIPIQRLQASNETQLKEVFFSGNPWLVACINSPKELFPYTAHVGAAELISMHGYQVATLNCNSILPSKKTVFERFSLSKSSDGEVVAVVANGKKPRQLPAYALKTPESVVDYAASYAKVKVFEPYSDRALQADCASKQRCIVVLKNGTLTTDEKSTIKSVAKEYRAIGFAFINAESRTLDFGVKELGLRTIEVESTPITLALRRPPKALASAVVKTLVAKRTQPLTSDFLTTVAELIVGDVQDAGDYVKTPRIASLVQLPKPSNPPPPARTKPSASVPTPPPLTPEQQQALKERQIREQLDQADNLIQDIVVDDDDEQREGVNGNGRGGDDSAQAQSSGSDDAGVEPMMDFDVDVEYEDEEDEDEDVYEIEIEV
eukprot:m.249111 g.249111  ORF g.249111 m.249111 type:complete len:509 (-) comp15426_c0_seq2:1094-2620(-)